MILNTTTTVAQAATIINAAFTFVQFTFGLALVVVLISTIHSVNSAITWSAITRKVHSSLWPMILRADSNSSGNPGYRAQIVSAIGLAGSFLVIISGIITPLGLKGGPLVQISAKDQPGSYIPDMSPIGLATSPRDRFTYSRICGATSPVPCPGNGKNGNTSSIAPSVEEIFSSTPHGPFNMQYRRIYNGTGGYNYSLLGTFGIVQSNILRHDVFAVDGLVVDLTNTNPGVGLWNHTIPSLPQGGVWSHNMLWLEPVTSCVDTNMTIDYTLTGNDNFGDIENFNITDRGGMVNLTTHYPTFSLDGQPPDMHAHAYKFAVLNNFNLMKLYNLTRNESYVGKVFPTPSNLITAGKMQYISASQQWLGVRNDSTDISYDVKVLCEGYGGGDTAKITTMGIHCALLAGPPYRTDGGDPRIAGDNSTWGQAIYACASVTRARIQAVRFSYNDSSPDLTKLTINRENISSVLWAVEKSDLNVTEVDLFWGHVADSYEFDPSLSTLRSDAFYLPAGGSDSWGVGAAGQPPTVNGEAWAAIYDPITPIYDYSGSDSYALLTKWQTLLASDPTNGPAQISNLIWTDIVSNNLMGSDTARTLSVAAYRPSLTYDFLYGIPALILLGIWLPVLLTASVMLLAGIVAPSQLRYFINQTSVGRVVVGDSALVPLHDGDEGERELPSRNADEQGLESLERTPTGQMNTKQWASEVGHVSVAFIPQTARTDSGEDVQLLSLEGRQESTADNMGDTSSDMVPVKKESLRTVLAKGVGN